MKKMIITIILFVLIALAVILYRSLSDNTFKDVAGEKNSAVIVKSFLDMMIPHHQEAVDSSLKVMNDLDITEGQVRIFAANVVDTQSFEISKMKNIYVDYLGQPYAENITLDVNAEGGHSMEYHNMMTDTSALKGDDLAKVYTADMIKHHESAVEMAEDYIKVIDKVNKSNSTKSEGLVITNTHPSIDATYELAKQIIDTQTKEIELLKTWYK
jgi:uncharacterized protein (DUF305 family)